MTPSFWLALAFYLVAAAWTWFWVRPRMNRMLELTERAIAGSEKTALLLADAIRELRRVAPPERVEKLLGAVEKWTGPKIHRSDAIFPTAAGAAAPPLPTGPGELGEPPEFGE